MASTPRLDRGQRPRRRRLPHHLPTCWAARKIRYPDAEAALEVIQSAAAARGLWGDSHRRQERRWYECHHCHGVHVTSQALGVRRPFAGKAG